MNENQWKGNSGWGEWYPRFPITTHYTDVTKLKFSAKSFLNPTHEVYQLLNFIAFRAGIAEELKKAAELNETKKVDQIIRSTGVKTDFKTRITPDGIQIQLQPDSTEACFTLTLSLCW